MRCHPALLPVLLAASIGSVSPVFAQDAKAPNTIIGSETVPTSDDLLGALDLGPPTLPLFTLMGANPESVVSPKTSAELAAAIVPSAIDAFGNETVQLGISINPGLMMIGEEASADDIVSSQGLASARALARTSLSFAFARAPGSDGYSQMGLGFSYTYDAKSPLQAYPGYVECTAKVNFPAFDPLVQKRADAWTFLIGKMGLSDTGKEIELLNQFAQIFRPSAGKDVDKELEKALKDAGVKGDIKSWAAQVKAIDAEYQAAGGNQEAANAKTLQQCAREATAWNRPLYAAGIAGYRTDFTNGKDKDGYTVWATLAQPFGEDGQGMISARIYDDLARATNKDGTKIADYVDGWSVGARYTHQIAAEKLKSWKDGRATRGFIEAAYTEEDFGSFEDSYWQAGIGAEVKLRQSSYLQFLVGRSWGSEVDRDPYISAQIKWALSDGPLQ